MVKVRTSGCMISFSFKKNSMVMAKAKRAAMSRVGSKWCGIRDAPYAGMGSFMTIESQIS